MTKRLPSDKKTLFLMCEGIREEPGNKLTLLGVYTAQKLLVPTTTETVLLPSLAFLFVFRDGFGTFQVRVSLRTPSGVALIDEQPMKDAVKLEAQALSLIVQVVPFQTNEFGDFEVIVTLNSRSYERSFAVVKSDRPSAS